MYLMMRRVFDELGYRRYEWKCDSLKWSVASRRAAPRQRPAAEPILTEIPDIAVAVRR
jgi:hypothetical protein